MKESNRETEGLAYLYNLHSYELQSKLEETKGATLTAVDVAPILINGEPAQITKLAVVAKKKVVVYKWVDDEISEVTVRSVLDRPHNVGILIFLYVESRTTG